MDKFDISVKLSTIGEQLWCIWLTKTNANEYQQTPQSHLAILEWLIQSLIHNLLTFAEPIQLSSCFIVLRCNGNLFWKCSRFPYQERTINEWFTLPVEGAELQGQPVNVINVDTSGKERKCYATQNNVDNFPKSLFDVDYEVFFHGTSHRFAQNIIRNGIDVQKGRARQDYSSEDGFYLGNNFEQALRWTGSRGLTPPAVLVFRVQKSQLRGEKNEKGLDLRNDSKEWEEVVTQFRSRDQNKISKLRKRLRKHEFIEGPMASVSEKNPNPKLIKDSYQLCVKRDNCAKLFNQSLHSAVFFDR